MRYAKLLSLTVIVGLGGVAGCGRRECPQVGTTEVTSVPFTSWSQVVEGWPKDSRSAAREMADKYGPPDEMTQSQLIWFRRGQWKRSVVSREPVHHEWPTPHEDVLEQFMDYKVPPERVSDLARFDGSVIVERTKGELSARCGGEAANFLALNLAKDVIDNRRSVDDARSFYEGSMKAYKSGQKPEYMQGLRFSMAASEAADPDMSAGH